MFVSFLTMCLAMFALADTLSYGTYSQYLAVSAVTDTFFFEDYYTYIFFIIFPKLIKHP